MRDRERHIQEGGEAGSLQGARCGTWSRGSRIMPWAKGRCSTTEAPRCPNNMAFEIWQVWTQFISLPQCFTSLSFNVLMCTMGWIRYLFHRVRFFFSFLSRYNWHITLYWSQVYMIQYTCKLQNDQLCLVNIHHSSCTSCLVMKTFKIYFLSNF